MKFVTLAAAAILFVWFILPRIFLWVLDGSAEVRDMLEEQQRQPAQPQQLAQPLGEQVADTVKGGMIVFAWCRKSKRKK